MSENLLVHTKNEFMNINYLKIENKNNGLVRSDLENNHIFNLKDSKKLVNIRNF